MYISQRILNKRIWILFSPLIREALDFVIRFITVIKKTDIHERLLFFISYPSIKTFHNHTINNSYPRRIRNSRNITKMIETQYIVV